MLLMIDNYDSFTWNVVQYLGELGASVEVLRNDAEDLAAIRRREFAGVVISPGPCTPDEAGVSVPLVQALGAALPILGICLGHQGIGQAYGGCVVRARQVMHGKISAVHHDGRGVFKGLPTPFQAARYHSLVVERASLPGCLEISAWTETEEGEMDEIMGLRHQTHPVEGVQFHPESIASENGHALLKNFLDQLNAAGAAP